MLNFESVPLWVHKLARQPDPDIFNTERERLRTAFLSIRDRASMLAGEIARDLPDYTVHDITHLDALWRLADLISGPDYPINPAEAFVLGAAFLIHDLGNGLAAYPEGISAMYSSTLWRDSVSILLRKQLGRVPTADEIRNVDGQAKKLATRQVLRTLHAQQAEHLGSISWRDPDSGAQRFLIEDVFLRETYARLIGRIAHSHWWSVDRLQLEFDLSIGAPAGYPAQWSVDPLKLACLLRVADAAHMDAGRAPAFLKSIRRPIEDSRVHWAFQERLQQPMRIGDRLVFTSARPFSPSEASSWWMAFDALQMLDKELAGVDSVLADCSRLRFTVHGVQGAEDAARLSKWVQTEAWMPVDSRIKVTDVAELASRLGGSQLYGQDNLVPLRELIQNASDAIRARRFIERRPVAFGDVRIRLGSDSEGHWIEIADNGIGMSEKVITGPLLDFGASFWNSEHMMQELPGLASSGFQSTGKYGIGFFSLFMWGSHVRISSRSYRDAPRDTRVLEFTKGLNARPILRRAAEHEFLPDAGTVVRVWVGSDPESETGILYRRQQRRRKIEELCAWLCPAVDVNIYVDRGGAGEKLVVGASDWKTLGGEKLLSRLDSDYEQSASSARDERLLMRLVAKNLTLVQDSGGEVVGRIAVIPQDHWDLEQFGAVTAGGIRTCGLSRIAGVLEGHTITADRSYAVPLVDRSELSEWASSQVKQLLRMQLDLPTLAHAADTVARCGGDIGSLPVAEGSRGWLSPADVRTFASRTDKIILADINEVSNIQIDYGPLKLEKNVLLCESGSGSFLVTRDTNHEGWPETLFSENRPFADQSNESRVVRLIAEGWSADMDDVVASAQISQSPKYFFADIGTVYGKTMNRSVNILKNPNRSGRKTRKKKRKARKRI